MCGHILLHAYVTLSEAPNELIRNVIKQFLFSLFVKNFLWEIVGTKVSRKTSLLETVLWDHFSQSENIYLVLASFIFLRYPSEITRVFAVFFDLRKST